jgi:hypothetical protein
MNKKKDAAHAKLVKAKDDEAQAANKAFLAKEVQWRKEKTDLLTRAKNDLAKEEALRLGRETQHKNEIAVKDKNHAQALKELRTSLDKEISSRQSEVETSKKNHLAEAAQLQ